MAGASIQVTVDDREVQLAFQRLLEQTNDLSDTLTEVGDYLTEQHHQRFVDEKSPGGEAWAPLSELTLSRKTVNADKILTEHGGLSDTLHYNVDSESLEFGSNLAYAAMMQFGGTTSSQSMFPNQAIPARPFLGINAEEKDEVVRIIEDHIQLAIASHR